LRLHTWMQKRSVHLLLNYCESGCHLIRLVLPIF